MTTFLFKYGLILMMMQNNVWGKENVKIYTKYDNSELEYIHPEFLNMLGIVKGRKIADYGCGEGKLLELLVEAGAKVFGYDVSDDMILESKKRMGDNAELSKIKSGMVPLSDNTLDSVVSNLVLMMCDSIGSIKQIYKEVNRILKPGGNWIYCITHPAFIDKQFTTYRNIFDSERDYFKNAQQYRFILRKKDKTEITDESFIDYHYMLSTYLNLLYETGFLYEKMSEIEIPGNKLPPYLIIKAIKSGSIEAISQPIKKPASF